MRWLAVALLLLWPIAAGAYDANGSEDLCAELGSACKCSEPFNFNADMSGGLVTGFFNPPDTSAKQCDGDGGVGNAYYRGDGYNPGPNSNPPLSVRANDVVATPFPSGANPYVLSAPFTGTQHIFDLPIGTNGGSITMGASETACVRSYSAIKAGVRWPPSGPTTGRIKSLILSGTGFHINFEWSPTDGGTQAAVGYALSQARIWNSVDPVTSGEVDGGAVGWSEIQNPCQGYWCRFEVCIDKNGSAGRSRFRWVELKSGGAESHELDYPTSGTVNLNGSTGTFAFTNITHMDLFTQCNPSDGCDWSVTDPRIYVSSVIGVITGYDPTFWIGAASELEGPGSTPPGRPARWGRSAWLDWTQQLRGSLWRRALAEVR